MNKIELEKILISKDVFERENNFLINKYLDLIELYNAIPEEEKIKFCYLYKKNSHKIIYEEEKTIKIENFEYNLKDYFYLSSAIEDDLNIINYSYDIDLINTINSNNTDKIMSLRLLINSKIILVLTRNFLQDNKTEDDNISNLIAEIEKKNTDLINNNITILKELGLNKISLEEIKGRTIGSLYIDIIKSLFRKNKFEDYEYYYDIINQLDMENINITKPMFVELSKFLNSNDETFLNLYKINNIEDLFNKKIINFYYILFKYIFKKENIIYWIPKLLEIKKIIINAIKKKDKNLFSTNLNDNDLIARKEYILKFITDSPYYYKKNWNTIKEQLNIILIYYQHYYFETKNDEINTIQEIISNENGNYEKFFPVLDIANKMNNRYEIIKIINDLKHKDEQKESNLQKSIEIWKNIEKLINDKKIDQIELDYKNILKNYLQEEKNKEIMIKIFNQDIYDFLLSQFKKEIHNKEKEDIKNENELYKYNDISYERLKLIDYLFNNEDKDKDSDNKIQKNEYDKLKDIKYWNEIEKNFKRKKLNKIKKPIIAKINNFFKDEQNKELLSKIFTPESIIFLINYNDRKEDNIKLEEILQYYKQYFPETKKNDINRIEEMIKNFFENNIKYENYEKYLIDYKDAKKMNIRTPIIRYLIDPKNEGILITEEIMKKEKNKWNNDLEKMIKEKKTKKISKEIKIKIRDYFENKENNETLLRIFSKDDIDYIIKNFSEAPKDNNSLKDKKDKEINKNKELNQNKQNDADVDNNNGLNLKKKNVGFEQNKVPINYVSTMKQTEDTNTMKTKERIVSEIIEETGNIKDKEININENNIEDSNNIKEERNDINKNDIKKKEKEKDIVNIQEKNIIKNILKKNKIKFHILKKEEKNCIELDEIKYGKRLIQLRVDKWNKIIEKYKDFSKNDTQEEIFSNFKKYGEFFDGIKNEITNKFKLDYKLEIELDFETINNKDNNEIYNISYTFYPPLISSKQIEFNDNNIVFPNISDESFQNLLEEINKEKYKKYQNENMVKQININDSLCQQNILEKTNINDSSYKVLEENKNIQYQNNKYKIITFEKIIGNHKDERNICTAEFIKELSNFYVSGGTDKILRIYDFDFNKKKDIEDIKEWTYSISERKTNKKNTFQILASSNKDLYIIDLKVEEDIITYNLQKYEFPNMTNVCCIEMANEDYATVGLYCSYYFYNLFNRKSEKVNHIPIINNKTYRPAIKIKNNILALASNRVAVDGEDKLFFFNSKSKKVSNEIKDYSFNFTVHGLSLIESGKKDSPNKIMLCACKKYFSDQKNGILLLNPEINDKVLIDEPFYDTGNFEVYCFCPISIKKYSKIDENKKDESITNNDYFFVGGFDVDKKEGKIRLYRVIFSENKNKTKIEYLQDIELHKENKENKEKKKVKLMFEGPINCMIQIKNEKNEGKILATCYDGNVYLFSSPNLTFYEKIKNNEKDKS